jgi:large subunit ribosomal protein L14
MVQNETNLVVADNSGARIVRIFRQYGGGTARLSTLGDIVMCAVKDAMPNGKIKKGQVVKGVIVRVKRPVLRKDGSTISFDDNAVVLIDGDGNPLRHPCLRTGGPRTP